MVSGKPDAFVSLKLRRDEGNAIRVFILATPVSLSEVEKKDIFEQYYGDLIHKTNLHLGSGLEGFIARLISINLNLPINLQSDNNILSFQFQVSKDTGKK